MKPIELSIDLGSTKTSIHKVGSGLIVNDESRVVVMTKNNGMTLIESGKGVEKYLQKPVQGLSGGKYRSRRSYYQRTRRYLYAKRLSFKMYARQRNFQAGGKSRGERGHGHELRREKRR